MADFFASCPVGYENELAREMREFWFEMMDPDGLPTRAPFPELDVITGGVQFAASEHLGYQVNFFSKLAGRVLQRIAKFEARYFDQFESGLSKVDLNKFLDFVILNKTLRVKVESHKSRLNNEKNLLEATQNTLSRAGIKISAESKQSLYIRIDKDRVTVSLDTTGEHLHRRGYAEARGEAPIRETLGAYMVRKLHDYAVFNEKLIVLDPFAGSGTLLFETLSWNLPNLNRDYSWLHFKNAPKIFKSESWRKNYRWHNVKNESEARAFEIDENTYKALNSNAERFKVLFDSEKIALTAVQTDSANQKIVSQPGKNVWILTNPPYGVRLAGEEAKQIIENLSPDVDGLVVVHPEKWNFNFSRLKCVLLEDFSNQGLKLKLSVFIRSATET